MESSDPQYETLMSAEAEDQLMMSRLNWMTYLKLLFDKLNSMQTGQSINLQQSSMSNSTSNDVDIYQLLEALSQIKNLLPLQNREEYQSKHGNEKGFTIYEVEYNLKRFLIINGHTKLSWDDVIDMFLSNKLISAHHSRPSHHSNYQTVKPNQLGQSNFPQMSEQDDLVNISEDIYGTGINEEFLMNQRQPSVMQLLSIDRDLGLVSHQNSSGKKQQIKICREEIVRESKRNNQTAQKRGQRMSMGGNGVASLLNENDFVITQMINTQHSNNKNSDIKDYSSNNSHGHNQIVKKIDFKDSILQSEKPNKCLESDTIDKNYYVQEHQSSNYNGDRTSMKMLSKQRNDSKQTLGNTNQHCSFYLTPSSGMQTPTPCYTKNQPKIVNTNTNYQYINIPTEQSQNFDDTRNQDRRDSSSSAFKVKNSTNNVSEISSKIFSYKVPFESAFNSQFKGGYNIHKSPISPYNIKPLKNVEDMLTENKLKTDFYDIVYTNQRCVSSIQMPNQQIKREQNSCLRGVNLNKNLFSMIGQAQIIDDSMISQHRAIYTWPYVEVLDITDNKLNDYYEILHLLNDNTIKKDTIKIIGVRGNSFYNYFNAQNGDFCVFDIELESQQIIERYSQYYQYSELQKLCFNYHHEVNMQPQNISQSRTSINQNPINTLSMILNQKFGHGNQGQLAQSIDRLTYQPLQQQHHKHLSVVMQSQNDNRLAKTRIDMYRSTNRSPSELTGINRKSRSNSRDIRPNTQLFSFQQNPSLRTKIERTSTSFHNPQQSQHFTSMSKTREISRSKKGSISRIGHSQAQEHNVSNKYMSQNFNKAVSELQQKLSLKDKRKTSANISAKIEKPLSRNVRFLDLSNNNHSSYNKYGNGLCTSRRGVGDSTTLNINNSQNGSKSQLSFASITPIQVPNKLTATQNSNAHSTLSMFKVSVPNNKRSILSNQLKRSIDLTLSLQFHQKKESTQPPKTQPLQPNLYSQKQSPASMSQGGRTTYESGVLKRKQSSPNKPSRIIGPLNQKNSRQPVMQHAIAGDLAEDVDECSDEDDDIPQVQAYNENLTDHSKHYSVLSGENSKLQTFICKEATIQKPHQQVKTAKIQLQKTLNEKGKENTKINTNYNNFDTKVRQKKQSVPYKSFGSKL
eukprot:403358362